MNSTPTPAITRQLSRSASWLIVLTTLLVSTTLVLAGVAFDLWPALLLAATLLGALGVWCRASATPGHNHN